MCSTSSCSRRDRPADLDGPRPAAAARRRDPLGQVGQADLGPVGEDRRPLDGVAQLAEVARPGVAGQRLAGLGREAGQPPAGLAGEEASRWSARSRMSARCAERGQRQLDHVEPVEQVLAERARGDRRLQVAVGRRDEPDVGRRGSSSRRPARTSAPGGTAGAWAGAAAGRSPTSSRNSVPPSAAATLPAASRTAPVKAPRAWPNRSLSSSSALRLGQLTVTNGPSAGGSRRGGRGPAPPCRCRSRPGSARRPRSGRPAGPGRGRAAPPGRRPRRSTSGTSARTRSSRSATRSRRPRTRATRSSTARTWAGVNGLGR